MSEIFEEFRIKYPGTKRGARTEFDHFRNKHKNYKQIVHKLLSDVMELIEWRNTRMKAGIFTPEYPLLSTWINQQRWEDELDNTHSQKKKTVKKVQQSSIDSSRIPPQALELEQAVLGAVLLEPAAIEKVEDLLRPEDFYHPANQAVYRAILHLKNGMKPIDMLTVTEALKESGELEQVGGPFYICQLTGNIGGSSHLEYHACIVREKSDARRLIEITSDIVNRAYDPSEDLGELMETAEKLLTGLCMGYKTAPSNKMEEALRQSIKRFEELEQLRRSGKQVAIPTGLPHLDKALNGGNHPTDLIALGGRPSMGKTQLALSFIKAAAQSGFHTLFVSAEMAQHPLVTRYLLEDPRISSHHLRTGQMTTEEWAALDETAATLWNLPIHIAAGHEMRNLQAIRSEARRLKRKGQLDQITIDHVGMIQTGMTFQRRYQEIGYITSELKNLAKELNVPIILLSQLNRPIKGARIEQPQLEDLRESGNIE